MTRATNRGFRAYFWTQFLGAFNDNYYKIACTMLVTYRIAGMPREAVSGLVALAAGLFILPFFLFSATAGQIADRIDKVILIRWIKFVEIFIMGGAVIGFATGSIPLLLVMIFFMGGQSAFFGPVKYSIIPELLPKASLMKGNGLVETGTFLSILTGTILGGFSIAIPGDVLWETMARIFTTATGAQISIVSPPALLITASAVLILSLSGFLFSLMIPKMGRGNPIVKLSPNILSATVQSLRFLTKNQRFLPVIVSISFFWFYGAFLLQIIPVYTRFDLKAGEGVFTLALAMFSIGIGFGSFLGVWVNHGRVSLRSVPFGLAGLILSPILAILVGTNLPFVMGVLFLIGVSGGLYIVPLYAVLQDACPSGIRSRIIAAGCILDAFFMVAASVLFQMLSGSESDSTRLFAMVSFSAVVVGVPLLAASIKQNRFDG